MTPERYALLHQIFEIATSLRESERSAYLDQVCAVDQELREEMDSLLAPCPDEDQGFFSEKWIKAFRKRLHKAAIKANSSG